MATAPETTASWEVGAKTRCGAAPGRTRRRSSARAEYEVTALAGGGLRVRHLLGGGEGSDLLFGVENLAFADGVVAADSIGLAAPVVTGIATDTGMPGDGLSADLPWQG